MAGEADWAQLQNAYGLQQSDINSLKSAGYSSDQASQLLRLSSGGGGTRGGGNLGGGQGSVAVSPTIGGSGLSPQTLIGLAGALKGGGGGGQGAATGMPVSGVNPNQPLTNLGAAALDQNAVYNPQPGAGGIDPVSGVNTQQPAITTSGVIPNVQQGPWTRTPGMFVSATGAVTPGTQIARPLKPGQQPTQQGPKYQGPTQVNLAPNFAMPQPTAPLPVTPTPQATGMAYRPGQSWATPPPAPGITFGGGSVPMPMGGGGQQGVPQGVPQNWQGAGQVAPSGIPSGGGVPGSAIALGNTGAQPAPYTGTVHNDPFMSNAVSKLMGLASNPWHPEGSSKEPIKMASGGWVPGDPNDNTDSVPAWLKPGEYVIPKGEAREIPRGLLGGGITPATQSKYYPPPAPSNQQQSTQSRAASTHTDAGAANATMANLGKLYGNAPGAGAVYDAQGNVVTSSSGLTAQAAAGAGSTMDASGAIRDPSGLVYDSSANLAAQDVGGAGATMPGGGAASGATTGGGMGNAVAGGIGAIGGALQKMFDPSNIGSWKMQASHIPAAPSSQSYAPSYDLRKPIV